MQSASAKSARAIFAAACLLVAVSTFALSDRPSGLTALSFSIQAITFVLLNPSDPVRGDPSSNFATHWALAILINVIAFSLVAGPMLFLGKFLGKALPVLLIGWLVMYFLLLFVLFPITDLNF